MRPIVLASGSPRRRELLRQMGIRDFEVVVSDCDESVSDVLTPAERVTELAKRKAGAVAARRPDACVIGADTIVAADGTVLGKPTDCADAARMLRLLSGRTHQVFTGVAVLAGGQSLTAHVCTEVEFVPLTEADIRAYVATGEPMDKAGAYGVQGRACVFVRAIRGDFYNVMGLPVCTLHEMLQKADASERTSYS